MDTKEENESKISDKADDKEILNKQNEHEEKKIKGPKDTTNSEPSGTKAWWRFIGPHGHGNPSTEGTGEQNTCA